MLGQRRRRCPNIIPVSGQGVVFSGRADRVYWGIMRPLAMVTSASPPRRLSKVRASEHYRLPPLLRVVSCSADIQLMEEVVAK